MKQTEGSNLEEDKLNYAGHETKTVAWTCRANPLPNIFDGLLKFRQANREMLFLIYRTVGNTRTARFEKDGPPMIGSESQTGMIEGLRS